MIFPLIVIVFLAFLVLVPEAPFILLVLAMTAFFSYGIYCAVMGEDRMAGS